MDYEGNGRQITGMSSSPQEPGPRRKIRRGLFESDDTLSGHTLPGAPNPAAWPTARADPADRRAPGEDGGQAEPETTLPRHCASPPSSTCLQTLKANPALAARAQSHHRPLRRRPQIPV